jgi:hypothetical protein
VAARAENDEPLRHVVPAEKSTSVLALKSGTLPIPFGRGVPQRLPGQSLAAFIDPPSAVADPWK